MSSLKVHDIILKLLISQKSISYWQISNMYHIYVSKICVIAGVVEEYVILEVHLGSQDGLQNLYNYDIRILLEKVAY